ncbi:MAG: aerial mycelium formation protein [Actinomycetota bacterium]|nr:aerial mycelium formation protein [Actinomycetota bacterium]
MEQHRRRIDQVMDPSFIAGLEELDLDEIRGRRNTLDELDTEFSYYRRILHGRMDLLDFEMRRRDGSETRSLIEALPEILGDGVSGKTSNPLDRELSVKTPEFAGLGRRNVDKALADDFLSRLPFLEDRELVEIRKSLAEAEHEVSDQRRAVYNAYDVITSDLTRRYRDGAADADELLSAK